MVVSIGQLRHRIILDRIDTTSAGGGAEEFNWVTVAEMSASIVAENGREIGVADRISGTITHTITVRYRENIAPEMRFRINDRYFNIRAVMDPDGRRRWLICRCEEERL